jgi:hypothetical protein
MLQRIIWFVDKTILDSDNEHWNNSKVILHCNNLTCFQRGNDGNLPNTKQATQ